ncbi:hypothetical protein [Mucilaginibacter sp. CSA2-8R]|uniref:hypothetical protein n=1 Tax=Mucilaginibacter sp. CSA2-8R TaxID=3141542 RepID=UPI00315CE1EB
MTITQAQQESIREVLWHNLKFKETFDELYDHILTSIEHTETSEKLPHEIATDIIKSEFGGWEKLKELELSRQKQIQSQLRGKLWKLMKGYFRFPLILFTLLASSVFYYAADHLPRKIIVLIMFLAVMMPLLMCYRIISFPIKRWSRKYKASIKESVVEGISKIGLGLFNCLMFIPQLFVKDGNFLVINNMHASALALAAVVYSIYSLSAIRLFQEDLNVSLVP